MNERPKGRILRVKHGYNPNSSSMGSLIYALPVSLMAVTGGFALVSGIIFTRLLGERADNQDNETPQKAERPQKKEETPG